MHLHLYVCLYRHNKNKPVLTICKHEVRKELKKLQYRRIIIFLW